MPRDGNEFAPFDPKAFAKEHGFTHASLSWYGDQIQHYSVVAHARELGPYGVARADGPSIEAASGALLAEVSRIRDQTAQEMAAERAERIASLKKQLAELEGGSDA